MLYQLSYSGTANTAPEGVVQARVDNRDGLGQPLPQGQGRPKFLLLGIQRAPLRISGRSSVNGIVGVYLICYLNAVRLAGRFETYS